MTSTHDVAAYNSRTKIIPLGRISNTKFEPDVENADIGIALQYYRNHDHELIKAFLHPIDKTTYDKEKLEYPSYDASDEERAAFFQQREELRKFTQDRIKYKNLKLRQVKKYLAKSGVLKTVEGKKRKKKVSGRSYYYGGEQAIYTKKKSKIQALFALDNTVNITRKEKNRYDGSMSYNLNDSIMTSTYARGSPEQFPQVEKKARDAILKNKNNPLIKAILDAVSDFGGSMRGFTPKLEASLKKWKTTMKERKRQDGSVWEQQQFETDAYITLTDTLEMSFGLSTEGRKIIDAMMQKDKRAITQNALKKVIDKANALGFNPKVDRSRYGTSGNANIIDMTLHTNIMTSDFYTLMRKIDSIANKTGMEPSSIQMEAYTDRHSYLFEGIDETTRQDMCHLKVGFTTEDIVEDSKAMLSAMTMISNQVKKMM